MRKFILVIFFSEFTPLHYSAYNGHLEVTRLLVESKADVAAMNLCFSPPPSPSFTHYVPCSCGDTALYYAIKRKKADVAAYLRSIRTPQ
jgi:ankyrin repeat protein